MTTTNTYLTLANQAHTLGQSDAKAGYSNDPNRIARLPLHQLPSTTMEAAEKYLDGLRASYRLGYSHGIAN